MLYLCLTVFEGGHDDTTCGAGHTLHIAQHEGRGYGVGLAGTATGDNYGGIGGNKQRESLRLIEVDLLLCRFHLLAGEIVDQTRGRLPQRSHPQYQWSRGGICQSSPRFSA